MATRERGITGVGKYQIIEQVGEGAMGVVYRALDPVLNRTVAIKVMTDAVARDDDLRTRFLREAQAAGSLQHPNVITIYDFGEVDGHLFIAMEFVAGADLEELLRKGDRLSVVQRIDILVDVLSGLNYAHKRGVVHRDIKPANIRIDEEGRARIMDFGIAHLQSSKMTRTGLMVGTPAYMAPEQVTGGTIGPKTDIFSVGAVMYELFTSKRPFEGESLQSVFYKIVSQAPAELATFAPSLPTELNTIVMQALAKDPAHRFASAVEMANALTEARSRLDRDSSQPNRVSLQSAIDSGLSTRPTKPIRVQRSRLPLAVAAASVVVLAIAGAGIYAKLRSGATDTTASVGKAPPVASGPAVVGVLPTVPAPATAPTAPPAAPVQPAGRAAKTEEPSAPKTTKGNTPSAQELALFRSLQSSALDARRRASEAGANAEQLRAGDDHNTAASAALQQGKVAEAASHLTLAGTAWAGAERDARNAAATAAAAAAAVAKTRVAEPPKPDPIPVTPPVAAQAPAQSPAPVRPPPSNPTADIEAVVKVYEKAIESRDLGEVRRAYVGITPTQASAWDQFFRSVRSIRVTLDVGNLDVRGEAAEAKLTGKYEYVTSAGKNESQPANFQASFRHDAGVWKLTAVR